MNGLISGGLDNGVLLFAMQTANETDDVNEVWSGWGSVVFVMGMTAILALVAYLVIWQVFKTRQNRYSTDAALARDEAYRKLAEEISASQEQTSEDLTSLRKDMADIRQRVAAMERMLREVE